MDNDSLKNKLQLEGFEITPSAMEILRSTRMPIDTLIKEITKFWKGNKRIITREKAINLLLTIKSSVISPIPSNVIPYKEDIPRVLRKTYYTLKKFKSPVTAGMIAKITHRKKNTERIYLNKLVLSGLVTKTQEKYQEAYYYING